MTVPLLTPADTPIFDDLVIGDLEKHWEETLRCEFDDAEAEWQLTWRCCSKISVVCDVHYKTHRRQVRVTQAAAKAGGMTWLRCPHCNGLLPLHGRYEDFLQAVQL